VPGWAERNGIDYEHDDDDEDGRAPGPGDRLRRTLAVSKGLSTPTAADQEKTQG